MESQGIGSGSLERLHQVFCFRPEGSTGELGLKDRKETEDSPLAPQASMQWNSRLREPVGVGNKDRGQRRKAGKSDLRMGTQEKDKRQEVALNLTIFQLRSCSHCWEMRVVLTSILLNIHIFTKRKPQR